jgi:hypothetical protein
VPDAYDDPDDAGIDGGDAEGCVEEYNAGVATKPLA